MTDRTIVIRGQTNVVDECLTCGVVFAVPQLLYENQRKEGGYHFCPNGHQQGWSKDGCENAQLRRERDRLKQRVAQRDDKIETERKRTAAAKGQITKMKTRASAGVCPCCNRSFQNLRRHMTTKHPNYAEAAE